jgi:hypothetical protein
LVVEGGVGVSEGAVVGVAEAAGLEVVCPLSSSFEYVSEYVSKLDPVCRHDDGFSTHKKF